MAHARRIVCLLAAGLALVAGPGVVRAEVGFAGFGFPGSGFDGKGRGGSRPYSVYQNPDMAPNDDSNIHQNAYFTDVYKRPGPTRLDVRHFKTDYLSNFLFLLKDADGSASPTYVHITECASQQFDSARNAAIMVCGSFPDRAEQTIQINLLALDLDSYRVLAYADLGTVEFTKPVTQDFGAGAYFYVDDQFRPVIVGVDCHVRIYDADLAPEPGFANPYTVVADWNVCGTDDTPQPPAIDPDDFAYDLNLYALIADGKGNIWFSIQQGLVGMIEGGSAAMSQSDADAATIHYADLWDDNDAQSPKEVITNSNPASRDGKVLFLGTINMYQYQAGGDGIVQGWSYEYDNIGETKPGQVSAGAGTSPTIFSHGPHREYVAFTDNAAQMQVVVLDVDTGREVGKEIVFPDLGEKVANENSLIGWTQSRPRWRPETWIYAENNYGNDFCTVLGEGTTEPGFARFVLAHDRLIPWRTQRNETISIPSVVTQASGASRLVYTYNKKPDGWYFTALLPSRVERVVFEANVKDLPVNRYPPPPLVAEDPAVPTAVGINLAPIDVRASRRFAAASDDCREQILGSLGDLGLLYNNSYSALILAPTSKGGQNRVWIGMAFGLLVITY